MHESLLLHRSGDFPVYLWQTLANRLWRAGWGAQLEMSRLDYLQTVPPFPSLSPEPWERFPLPVLVDTRLALNEMHHALRIHAKSMRHHDIKEDCQRARREGKVYWIACQAGDRYHCLSQYAAVQQMFEDETGLDEKEGCCLFAQHRHILDGQALSLLRHEKKYFIQGSGITTVMSWPLASDLMEDMNRTAGTKPYMQHVPYESDFSWKFDDGRPINTPTKLIHN